MNRPICLLALALAATTVVAGQDQALKSQFQARYNAYVKAFLTKDVTTVSKLLGPDFTSGSPDHLITRQKVLADLKVSDGRFKTLSRKVVSVTVNRDKASVIEQSVTKGSLPDPKTRVLHAFVIEMTCLDTWQKNPAGWQLKHMRPVKTKTIEDGHLFKPEQHRQN